MEDKIAFIEKWDAFSAGKIRALLEKKTAMVEETNLYGERYTPRQFQIPLDQILKRETMRSRICEAVSQEVKPIRVIAEDVGLSPRNVLRHVVELRRRSLMAVDHIEDGKTPYYCYTAPGGSS